MSVTILCAFIVVYSKLPLVQIAYVEPKPIRLI